MSATTPPPPPGGGDSGGGASSGGGNGNIQSTSSSLTSMMALSAANAIHLSPSRGQAQGGGGGLGGGHVGSGERSSLEPLTEEDVSSLEQQQGLGQSEVDFVEGDDVEVIMAGPRGPLWPPTPPEGHDTKRPGKWRARAEVQTDEEELLPLGQYQSALEDAHVALKVVKSEIKELKTRDKFALERAQREFEEKLVDEERQRVQALRDELDARAKQLAAANRSELRNMEAVVERRLRDASAEERQRLLSEARESRRSLEKALVQTRTQLRSAEEEKEQFEEEVDRLKATNAALIELADGEEWRAKALELQAQLDERNDELAEARAQCDALKATLERERVNAEKAQTMTDAMRVELDGVQSQTDAAADLFATQLRAEQDKVAELREKMRENARDADDRLRVARGDLARESELSERRRDKHLRVIDMLTKRVQNLTGERERLRTQVQRYQNIVMTEHANASSSTVEEWDMDAMAAQARSLPDDEVVPTQVAFGVPSPIHVRNCVEGMETARRKMDAVQRRATLAAYRAASGSSEQRSRKVETLPFLTRVRMHQKQQAKSGFYTERGTSSTSAARRHASSMGEMHVEWRMTSSEEDHEHTAIL